MYLNKDIVFCFTCFLLYFYLNKFKENKNYFHYLILFNTYVNITINVGTSKRLPSTIYSLYSIVIAVIYEIAILHFTK